MPLVDVRNDALVWVRSGVKHLYSGDDFFSVAKDSISLLPRDSHWGLVNDPAGQKSYEADVLEFGDSALSYFYQKYRSEFPQADIEKGTVVKLDSQLLDSLSLCFETQRSTSSSLRLKIHRTVEVLILLAERGYSFVPRESISFPDRVRRLVKQAPHASWSSERISKQFHVSESTLRRRLDAHGITIHKLLSEVRLTTGLTLLKSTTLTVGEISQRCGYESHSRFSATFKQYFGLSPSQARTPSESIEDQHLDNF